ncbi:MAG: DUF4382 domain-containing protein [Bacteroidota bacterium]|nr:DUF4382 domain-containing protein [Bacteroidota bacterium]
MKNKAFVFSGFLVLILAMVMGSCNKSTSLNAGAANQQQLSLYLTDGPGLFDHVYIDILSVKVLVDTSADTRMHDNTDWDRRGADDHKNDSSLVWSNLNIKAGVYDVLSFRNGADTLLAASGIPKGSVRLIKIELGPNNSLVKDSVTYPLSLPPGSLNYVLLKLKGHECEEYEPGKNRLWLDFDITRSIVQNAANKFMLKPVIHFFVVSSSGSIVGKVLPKESYPVITVYNSTDTAYALPNPDGFFKLRGLKDGTYDVFINASNGYFDSTLHQVVVKAPGETSLGSITLRK